MSIRDRLTGKARRTVTVPVPVTDPGEDLRARAAQAAERADLAALAARTSSLDPAVAQALRDEADGLAEQVAEHYEDVVLGAVAAAEWEDLLSQYRTDDGEDLTDDALPAMLAACAVDEDLRDPSWWAEQLARPEWTFGEREALRGACLRVNSYQPRPSTGKG